ncbi:MAG: ABC transporter substrate-binding protein [Polyangiaceae bacterium]|nr:ABC transporter substrate-binding protein [Polyangiaceae bacterium]
MKIARRAVVAGLSLAALSCARRDDERPLAFGYCPTLLQAQPLVGATSGRWQRALDGATATPFLAGPAVMEALRAGAIDAGFLGASAVLGTFTRRGGVVVLSGASSGGASLVARAGLAVTRPSDVAGRAVSASQIGSMPDVALRAWLLSGGVVTRERGGDTLVAPLAQSEAARLLARGDLAAMWCQEPWPSRLVAAGATRAIDERDLWEGRRYPAVLLVTTPRALARRGRSLERLVALLGDETAALSASPDGGRAAAGRALSAALGQALPEAVLADAWSRVDLSLDPQPRALEALRVRMRALGYLPDGSLDGLVHPGLAA